MPARLSDIARCRLCWRVTFAVFVLILVIESLLLIPSARRFEDEALRRLAGEAALLVEPVLQLAEMSGESASSREVAGLIGQYRLAGLALLAKEGATLMEIGENDGLLVAGRRTGPVGMMPQVIGRAADGRTVDVAWRSARAGEPLVVARLDAAHIRGELNAYLLRIGGLVGVIVLVVTVGTMLVLQFALFRPLLALRRSALAAGAEPEDAARFRVGSRRQDEMGEVIRAHDAMLAGIAASVQRDRAAAEERARYLSHHEPLTGLPNRLALIEFLERARAIEGADRQAVLFLANVVRFRELNAGGGARRGDALLLRLAAILKRTASGGEFVAHLGADRFALARVRRRDEEDAPYAERLLRAIKSAGAGGETEAPRVRLGIASVRAGDIDPPGLLSQAEFALARTGAEGSGEYQFFSPELAREAVERQGLLRDLEQALGSGELFPVYQPKLSLAGAGRGRIESAEVLLRWTHPSRGAVSPARFIPLAETTGLIVPIGDFVLRAACAQMRAWLDRYGWSPRLAVNLSAQQFSLPDLRERLERALSEQRLPADLLEVEITETAAMRDVNGTAETLAALRRIGVHASIDDFGSGYSSLIYLHRFAVDAIKIDRSFIESIGVDHHGEAICDAVLRLGRALGTRVVAEGVETEGQLDFLRRRRCDEIQGYLIGKPVAAAEFERTWIAERAAA